MVQVKLLPLQKKNTLSKRIKFASSDFETNPITKAFKLVSISYKFRNKLITKTFFSVLDYIEFITTHNITIVYFYNLKFDITFLLDFIVKQENPNFFIIESESQTLGLILTHNGIRITFKDFYAFTPNASLEKICTTFNCPTKKYKVNFHTCTLDQLAIHCQHDCKMLYELIEKYRELMFLQFHVDCLDKKLYSLASLSVKIYRTNYLSKDKTIYNPFVLYRNKEYQVNEKLYKFVRKTYKGGFTNAFDNELHQNVNYYDINSSYPYQTTLINFPIGNAYFTDNYEVFLNNTIRIQMCGFLKCIIHFNNQAILPVLITDIKNNTYFTLSNNSVKQYITTLELEYLLKNNIKIEFIKGVYFASFDTSYSLSNFMQNIYIERKTYISENPLNYILKIILNGLTGKFGQKIYSKRNSYEIIDKDEVKEGLHIEVNEQKSILLTKTDSLSLKTFQMVSWSSLITSLGRIQLIAFCIENNGIYCDTDSIITHTTISTSSSELGGWKLEKNCLYYRALAPKMYALLYKEKGIVKREVKLKGVPFKHRNRLLLEILLTDNSDFYIKHIHHFYSYKQMLRLKNPEFKSDLFTGAGFLDKHIIPKLKPIL